MKRRAWLILLAAGVLIITGAAFFMGMRWKIDWEAAKFVESDKFLANRERGFYNMRGIRISDDSPVSGEILEEIMGEAGRRRLWSCSRSISEPIGTGRSVPPAWIRSAGYSGRMPKRKSR